MTVFLIILGFLPSFAWLLFFLKEDLHPEPKKLLAKVFIVGCLITVITVSVQIITQELLVNLNISRYSSLAFLLFGVAEETLKFLAAYLVVRKNRQFNEPIDAMIYAITAALGFAMIENMAVVFGIGNFPDAVGIIILRFVGATLLHALTSGIIGYYWALGIVRKKIGTFIAKGLVIGTVLHAFFNYLIMVFKDVMVYPTIFLIAVALLLFWDFEKIKKVPSFKQK